MRIDHTIPLLAVLALSTAAAAQTAVNDPAVGEATIVTTGAPVTIDVLANDRDVPADAEVVVIKNPSYGTYSLSGNVITYTPFVDGFEHFETDNLGYQISRSDGRASNNATVFVVRRFGEPAPEPQPDDVAGAGCLTVIWVPVDGDGVITEDCFDE